jgi:predicted nicotinamide N-methyase
LTAAEHVDRFHVNRAALALVRAFLDEVQYGYVLPTCAPQADYLIFPDFHHLVDVTRRLAPRYAALLTLLRTGRPVTDRELRRFMPGEVIEAFASAGLIAASHGDDGPQWQMPGLAVVCIDGLYLVVSVPATYATTQAATSSVYIGADSRRLTRAYPSNLEERSVLDVCAGSGVQGFVCLARGAAVVTALERDPLAVALSDVNAALNGLSEKYCALQSDVYAALPPGLTFDFITCNPPFVPVVDAVDYPTLGRGGPDGLRVVLPVLEGLAGRLSATGTAVVLCASLGDRNRSHLYAEHLPMVAESSSLAVSVFTHNRVSTDRYAARELPALLACTCPGMPVEERRARIAQWRAQVAGGPVPGDYIHHHLLVVRRSTSGPSLQLRELDVLADAAAAAAAG